VAARSALAENIQVDRYKSMRDFRLQPRYIWGLRSSGVLCGVGC
jgi:hypothetical protein